MKKFVNWLVEKTAGVPYLGRAVSCLAFLFAFGCAFCGLLRPVAGLGMIALALALAFSLVSGTSYAQTDITAAVTSMSSLWTSIEVIAIGVIVFVVGRKLFRKI